MGLALALAARGPRRAAAAVLLALGAGWCVYGLELAAIARVSAREPLEAVVEGRVERRSGALEPRWIELGRVRGLAGANRLRVYAVEPAHLDPWLPGDRLRLRGRWSPALAARNPGSRAAPVHRPALSGTLSHPSLVAALPSGAGLRRELHARRREIARALRDAGDAGGLLRGLALGDREALDPAARDAFRRLGLSHVLAVSGLHLLFVAAGAHFLARRVLLQVSPLAARRDVRRLALLPALAAAGCYAALAGWGVPVRRAWILLLAAAAAMLRGRPARSAPPLAAAALWILVREPAALFDLGAQLSFAVVAALGASAPAAPARPDPATGRRVGSRAPPGAVGLRRSASACLAAAPVLAWHGAGTSGVALLANVVALPLLAVGLLPAALLAALACGAGLPGAETGAHWAAGLSEAVLAVLSRCAEGLPSVARGPIGLAGFGAALALAVGGLATRSTAGRCALALLQTGLLAFAPAARIEPPPPRLVVFDVGQGDAALLQGHSGSVLVDGGGARGGWDAGRSRVVPALRALGVVRLDLVIATHADLDHRGGLPSVLDALGAGEVWLPAGRGNEPGFEALRRAARRAGAALREVGRGSPVRRFGDLRVEPLWPPRDGLRSRNAASLAVRVDAGGGVRVLLAGDLDAAAESELLARADDLRAEVLLVPHHGSRSSGSRGFLEAVAPRVALASAGCRNRFGMPHAALRRRVEALGIPLFWTGRDGALRVSLRGAPAPRGTGRRAPCPGAGPAVR